MGKGRTPCCEKGRVKKGPWSQAEDLKLITFIQRHGHNNWRSLPKLAGLARCGKSCRLRWVNYLRPDVKRGNFTFDEEETIIRLQSLLGNKWSKIASHLPGRTDNEIKNVWNTHLKKRLEARKSSHTDTKSTHHNQDKVPFDKSTKGSYGQGRQPPNRMGQMSSKDNETVELWSSDCTSHDFSHNATHVTLMSSTHNVDHKNDEPQDNEIPYDEPNSMDLWDSLLLDAGNHHDQSHSNTNDNNGTQTFTNFEGNTRRNKKDKEVESCRWWQFGLLENYEHGTINKGSATTTITSDGNYQGNVGDQKNKSDQLEGFPDNSDECLFNVGNMESYLEIMGWPSSPTYYSYLGF